VVRGGLGKSLTALPVGDVEGAVAAAVADGYLRLAMMIARAAESDKVALRADAAAQLEACGGLQDGDWGGGGGGGAAEAVSAEERMILAVLAGNVSAVARRLGLSWRRVFAMELLYGAGSSAELLHSERVSAAVGALEQVAGAIPARPPHGGTDERDAAYHLLRLYADPTASYPLTAGVFSASSFGTAHDPNDARFPWLLHQTLSALVPRAVLPEAVRLSDAYAGQLAAAGLPLWSFYVLCSGAPPAAVVKSTLLRLWPSMSRARIELSRDLVGDVGAGMDGAGDDEEDVEDEDGAERMGAHAFLVHVMKVPVEWVHEARALQSRADGGEEEAECGHWLRAGTAEGVAAAQALIARVLFPRAVAQYDAAALARIANWLGAVNRGTHPADWSTAGGLILDYLSHVGPETMARVTAPPAETHVRLMLVYKSMAQRVGAYMAAATTPMQRHAAVTIADGIVSAERVAALNNPDLIEDAMDDLESLPVSRATARRVVAEYKHQTADGGLAGAALFVSALPVYASFVGRPRPVSREVRRGTASVQS
jgi:hypothetical protein